LAFRVARAGSRAGRAFFRRNDVPGHVAEQLQAFTGIGAFNPDLKRASGVGDRTLPGTKHRALRIGLITDILFGLKVEEKYAIGAGALNDAGHRMTYAVTRVSLPFVAQTIRSEIFGPGVRDTARDLASHDLHTRDRSLGKEDQVD